MKRNHHICWMALAVSIAAGTCAAAEAPTLMDRQKEIALALSACPASLTGKAGVYVLEKAGYVKVRDSRNGFTAMVQHVLPISVEPVCMNEEATRTHLPRILKVAELRAQGKSAAEIRAVISEGIARGVFPIPRGPSITYMLSPQNLPASDDLTTAAPFPPHVMLWVPYVTNADLGLDGDPNGQVSIARAGTPDAVIITPVSPEMGSAHKHPTGQEANQ